MGKDLRGQAEAYVYRRCFQSESMSHSLFVCPLSNIRSRDASCREAEDKESGDRPVGELVVGRVEGVHVRACVAGKRNARWARHERG